ncbi:hypothetical protein JC221_126 [Yersinia phage JC221]|nr:hypothetical protein JC221_126 [Yersinia phage JC221]
MNNVMYPNSGSSLTQQRDDEFLRLVKEQNTFAQRRVTEESELTRRSLWIDIYHKVFNRGMVHTQARDAADAAVSAYDAKFTVTK